MNNGNENEEFSIENGVLIKYNGKAAEVKIPENVTAIGRWAFEACLTLKQVVLHGGVTVIGEYAFCSCLSLTSIVIPKSVTSIERYVFSSCSSLTLIEYGGTKAEWKNVKKGLLWDMFTKNLTIKCSDGNASK